MVMNQRQEQVEKIIDIALNIVNANKNLTVSQWAEEHRILTKKVSSVTGSFKYDNAPYTREIADRFSIEDPTRHIVVMKSVQAYFTTSVLESAIGYSIDYDPSPMMYVSADLKLLRDFKEVRINSLIDTSGLRDKIVTDTLNKQSRKQADTAEMLYFLGGFLRFCGSNNPKALRSFSIEKLFLDEVDGMPLVLKPDGNPVDLAVSRTDNYVDTRKIGYGSTPGLAHLSKIFKLFKDGDQREYFIPCPFCGCYQYLEFYNHDGGLYPDSKGIIKDGILYKPYGIIFDVNACKEGDYRSVAYKCKHCGELIPEYYKHEMELKGFWKPLAKSKFPNYVSYHITGLLSPKFKWENIAAIFLKAGNDPAQLQVFYNNYLGLPFEDTTSGVDITTVHKFKDENLPANTLPEEALFIVVVVDVQDDRLEVDIKAYGERFRSWGLDHRNLYGNTSDIYDQCWKELSYIPFESWNGLNATLGLIDSGDGEKTDIVYQFCTEFVKDFFYPLKGFTASVKTKEKYKIVKLQNYDTHLVEIYVDLYKNQLARWFNQEWRTNEDYPDGWMTFANSFTDNYFKQLTNEHKVKKVTKGGLTTVEWVKKGRNEAWDLNVYALCAAEIVIAQVSMCVLGKTVSDPRAAFEYYKRLRNKCA